MEYVKKYGVILLVVGVFLYIFYRNETIYEALTGFKLPQKPASPQN